MEIYTARSLRGAAGSWSSGYDIALTQRRSPVRIRSSPFLSAGPGHGVRENGYGWATVDVGAATRSPTRGRPPRGINPIHHRPHPRRPLRTTPTRPPLAPSTPRSEIL